MLYETNIFYASAKRFVLLACLSLIVVGCLDTTGSHKRLSGQIDNSLIPKYSDLTIDVISTPAIPMRDYDKTVMVGLIIRNLQMSAPGRFQSINSSAPTKGTLMATVRVTRYDQGNAPLRRLTFGLLGQIHIEAEVVLSDWFSKTALAKYNVSKIFAGTTERIQSHCISITDLHDPFARAVVNAILCKD
jgi:hypothetical protein